MEERRRALKSNEKQSDGMVLIRNEMPGKGFAEQVDTVQRKGYE